MGKGNAPGVLHPAATMSEESRHSFLVSEHLTDFAAIDLQVTHTPIARPSYRVLVMQCRGVMSVGLLPPLSRTLGTFRLPIPCQLVRHTAKQKPTHSRSQSSVLGHTLRASSFEAQPTSNALVNAKASLNASQLQQAQQYIALLMTQNATMNLTGMLSACKIQN